MIILKSVFDIVKYYKWFIILNFNKSDSMQLFFK